MIVSQFGIDPDTFGLEYKVSVCVLTNPHKTL